MSQKLWVLDVGDWYDSSYSSLSFRVPGGFCVFPLFIWACPLWLVRLVILVATVIASIVVLWKSLMFWNSLLRLASLIVFSVACTVLSAIFLICVVSCFKMTIIRMIIVISVCRGVLGLGCSLFGFTVLIVFLLCPILGLASCWLVLLFFLPSFFLFALFRKVYRLSLSWVFS